MHATASQGGTSRASWLPCWVWTGSQVTGQGAGSDHGESHRPTAPREVDGRWPMARGGTEPAPPGSREGARACAHRGRSEEQPHPRRSSAPIRSAPRPHPCELGAAGEARASGPWPRGRARGVRQEGEEGSGRARDARRLARAAPGGTYGLGEVPHEGRLPGRRARMSVAGADLARRLGQLMRESPEAPGSIQEAHELRAAYRCASGTQHEGEGCEPSPPPARAFAAGASWRRGCRAPPGWS
jgi:hypothetical protein